MRAFAVAMVLFIGVARAAGAENPVLPLSAGDEAEITRLLGAGVVGKALPSKPIADVSVYFPLVETTSIFQVTSGSNAGKHQTLGMTKGKRPGGNDAWRLALSPSLAGFINSSGGNLMMPAVSDHGEGVIVVTTPANPFVLSGMKPGESRKLSQTVSVNYLDDPTDQRYSGSLTGTFTYVGTYEVTVPAGHYEAILLRQDFSGKVGPAHTKDTAYYFFAPGVGVVAMISQEDVEAFYFIHIDTSSGKTLVSQEKH
jgi:hypothetical protein